MTRAFILTLDCDWAPDFVLEDVFGRIAKAGAHATLFVTNPSPALPVTRFQGWELGWHPNFLPGSTQGQGVAQICAYLSAIAPGARSLRTHALHQSTFLFRELLTHAPELAYDSSLYLPGQTRVDPFELPLGEGQSLRRFPIVWEDDFNLAGGDPLPFDLENLACQGACVVDFHPIHVYLNTADLKAYAAVKALGPLTRLTRGDLEPYRNRGEGIGNLFDRALQSTAFTANLSEFAAAEGAAA